MEQSSNIREWLDWLTRVRLLMITLILAVGVVWPQELLSSSTGIHYFLPIIIFWITIGILHLILQRSAPQARWHGPLQIVGDVLLVSLLVYTTGLQAVRLHNDSGLSGTFGGHDSARAVRQDSTHVRDRAGFTGPAHLVPHQYIRLLRRSVSCGPPGPVAATQGPRTEREERRAAEFAGLHRRYYPLHARRIADHRPPGTHPAPEPHRGRHFRTPFRRCARHGSEGPESRLLAAGAVRRERHGVPAQGD